MKVTLPDGTPLELPDGATGADAAAAIGPGLARAALAVKRERRGCATSRGRWTADEPLEIVTDRSGQDALELIRHDAAHVLAAAVMELYPGVKISIGPPIENGFYYDFEFPDGRHDLRGRLRGASRRRCASTSRPTSRSSARTSRSSEALERFRAEGQDYKVELIEDLVANDGVETVSLYTNGPFTDLCRGPHAPSTKRIGAFKLQSVAGAYWRGDADRPMLTRIYGTAFFKQKELDEHLERLEQARARDHRKLGRELGLFTFSRGLAGLDLLAAERHRGVQRARRAQPPHAGSERGYGEVKTPHALRVELWKTSGHWDKYKENMFVTEYEDREFGLKPMNCPGHCQLFGLQRWSYRDLPVRYAEPGLLHRHEPSGTLHGLLRVRHFTQDDAHIFCTEEQIQDEVAQLPGLRLRRSTGCSTSPCTPSSRRGPTSASATTSSGTTPRGRWPRRSSTTASSTRSARARAPSTAPKIDLHMTDSLGRSWQLGTVQLDYNMPERFELTYTGADNAEHRPVMIHRALFGSFERFIGILLEHYAGELPLWLAPVQAIVLPIADRHNDARATPPSTRCAPPGCARRSTTAPSRSGARSATPSCRRSPTCSWSATARPRRGRSPCAATARATRARWRSASSSSGSPARPPPGPRAYYMLYRQRGLQPWECADASHLGYA